MADIDLTLQYVEHAEQKDKLFSLKIKYPNSLLFIYFQLNLDVTIL